MCPKLAGWRLTDLIAQLQLDNFEADFWNQYIRYRIVFGNIRVDSAMAEVQVCFKLIKIANPCKYYKRPVAPAYLNYLKAMKKLHYFPSKQTATVSLQEARAWIMYELTMAYRLKYTKPSESYRRELLATLIAWFLINALRSTEGTHMMTNHLYIESYHQIPRLVVCLPGSKTENYVTNPQIIRHRMLHDQLFCPFRILAKLFQLKKQGANTFFCMRRRKGEWAPWCNQTLNKYIKNSYKEFAISQKTSCGDDSYIARIPYIRAYSLRTSHVRIAVDLGLPPISIIATTRHTNTITPMKIYAEHSKEERADSFSRALNKHTLSSDWNKFGEHETEAWSWQKGFANTRNFSIDFSSLINILDSKVDIGNDI